MARASMEAAREAASVVWNIHENATGVGSCPLDYYKVVRAFERALISEAIARYHTVSASARSLGLNRTTLIERLKALDRLERGELSPYLLRKAAGHDNP